MSHNLIVVDSRGSQIAFSSVCLFLCLFEFFFLLVRGHTMWGWSKLRMTSKIITHCQKTSRPVEESCWLWPPAMLLVYFQYRNMSPSSRSNVHIRKANLPAFQSDVDRWINNLYNLIYAEKKNNVSCISIILASHCSTDLNHIWISTWVTLTQSPYYSIHGNTSINR